MLERLWALCQRVCMELEFIEGEILKECEIMKDTLDDLARTLPIRRLDDEKYPSMKYLFLKLLFVEMESFLLPVFICFMVEYILPESEKKTHTKKQDTELRPEEKPHSFRLKWLKRYGKSYFICGKVECVE